jgi:hypothetical protein
MTYEEFWPRYLASHADRRNRVLHYLATAGAVAGIPAAAITADWCWLIAAPVLGYGPAWLAHAAFERNRPEPFSHPIWSLLSDFRMLGLFLAGRIGGEPRRAGVER